MIVQSLNNNITLCSDPYFMDASLMKGIYDYYQDMAYLMMPLKDIDVIDILKK